MPYKILLVDDEADFREEFAESFDDYEITGVSCGEDAMSLLKKPNEIDMVILDVMMPGERGTDVLRDIKALAPSMKVLMLTGHSSESIAIDALKARADDYLQKPINIEKTRAIIAKYLNEKDADDKLSNDSTEARIKRVKKFIERNYHKKVSLNDAASAVALSPKYLSRIFEEKAGVGFSEYKLAVKVENAKDLLKRAYSVDQVSDKLGYSNTESFIRIFKKITGKTPSEFRNGAGRNKKRMKNEKKKRKRAAKKKKSR